MELEDVLKKYPNAETFKFGDSEVLSDLLISLVREGKKTATCGALRDYESGNEAMPVVGRQDIALNWNGSPALVIETVDIVTTKFSDVDEAFALAEGENESLEGWQHDHRQYFERNGGFNSDLLLVCERFKLIEDFAL